MNKTTTPKVSVIMTVYNGERYLRAAVESILNQSFRDLELIIVNDGSTDSTREIIESYKDARIIIINQENHGLVKSLNIGINASVGEYVARMDADDISLPDRIQKQVAIMDNDPGLAACGTCARTISEDGERLDEIHVLSRPEDLKKGLLLYNPFMHGSMMMKRDILKKEGMYDESEEVEDYELWVRLASKHKVINIPEVLYLYRINMKGLSRSGQDFRMERIVMVNEKAWKHIGMPELNYQDISKGHDFYKNNESAQRHLDTFWRLQFNLAMVLFKKHKYLNALRLLLYVARIVKFKIVRLIIFYQNERRTKYEMLHYLAPPLTNLPSISAKAIGFILRFTKNYSV